MAVRSEDPGRMFYNVPMLSVESYLSLQLRVRALEDTLAALETKFIDHRRYGAHTDVPRETEASTHGDPTLL